MLKGIDVSAHQRKINWAEVSVDFAILRAGYGRNVSQKDSYFEDNYKGCKAHGIPVGAYWYSYADSVADAHREAAACIAVLKGKQLEFPVYYDLEEGAQAAMGKAMCTAIAEAFCSDLEKAGFFVGIYANTNWFNNYLDHAYLSNKYTIWLADYRLLYNKSLTRAIHQYSSNGSVPGISGRVDMDNCSIDFAPIIKKAGLNGFSKLAVEDNGLTTIKMVLSKGDAKAVTEFCEERDIPYEVV